MKAIDIMIIICILGIFICQECQIHILENDLENTTLELQFRLIHNYNLTNQNQILEYELKWTQYDLEKLNSSYINLDNSNARLNYEYQKLNDTVMNEFHIPTKKELYVFMNQDQTDKREYDLDSFDCTEFSNLFISNLYEQNIYGCITELEFESGGHAIVAIQTTNDIVYIDPQQDKIINKIPKMFNGEKIKSISSCYEFEIRY